MVGEQKLGVAFERTGSLSVQIVEDGVGMRNAGRNTDHNNRMSACYLLSIPEMDSKRP
jgi:hypothetical protein